MRRPLAAALAAAVLLTISACTSDAGDATTAAGPERTAEPTTAAPTPTPTPTPTVKELPRGGRALVPTYRMVGFCGVPGAPALGKLVGPNGSDLDAQAREIEAQAAAYATDRPIQPVFELIAAVAQGAAGDDGQYRVRVEDSVIQTYLDAARRNRALLLLNIQPGRADFLPEVQAFEKWLREPDVGVALDPEWAVGEGQVPGRVYGEATGAELNSVAAYLARLVAQEDLPEKVMVFHQVAPQVVPEQQLLRPHPGVVLIKSVDGIGSPGAKVVTWKVLTSALEPHVRSGFKLFYSEDVEEGPLMTPQEVLALVPTPDYVMYE